MPTLGSIAAAQCKLTEEQKIKLDATIKNAVLKAFEEHKIYLQIGFNTMQLKEHITTFCKKEELNYFIGEFLMSEYVLIYWHTKPCFVGAPTMQIMQTTNGLEITYDARS